MKPIRLSPDEVAVLGDLLSREQRTLSQIKDYPTDIIVVEDLLVKLSLVKNF